MPRPGHPKNDPEYMRSTYRQFDLEDLVEVIGWMREIGERSFATQHVRFISIIMHRQRWGEERVRRIVRVGLDIGWLQPVERRRYQITTEAPATFPLFRREGRIAARNLGLKNEEAGRRFLKEEIRLAFDGATRGDIMALPRSRQ